MRVAAQPGADRRCGLVSGLLPADGGSFAAGCTAPPRGARVRGSSIAEAWSLRAARRAAGEQRPRATPRHRAVRYSRRRAPGSPRRPPPASGNALRPPRATRTSSRREHLPGRSVHRLQAWPAGEGGAASTQSQTSARGFLNLPPCTSRFLADWPSPEPIPSRARTFARCLLLLRTRVMSPCAGGVALLPPTRRAREVLAHRHRRRLGLEGPCVVVVRPPAFADVAHSSAQAPSTVTRRTCAQYTLGLELTRCLRTYACLE